MSDQVRQSYLFSAQTWQTLYAGFTAINFASYDFSTIRAALVDFLRFFYPEDFNDYINSSEFVALIDLLSYLGQTLAFRMDLNTRENFIDVAQRRQSILRLAQFLSYNPTRNQCANGLLKLVAINSNDDIIDSLGQNLNGQTINFNDPNNPDWLEQFILILNDAFITSNPYGKPVSTGMVGGISTQLYQFNSVAGAGLRYPFSGLVDGITADFEIVNTNFTSGQAFYENAPDPNAAFSLAYQQDGNGFSSPNTGFFVLFKQGTLQYQDFRLPYPVANRTLSPTATNVNNTDVWVQNVLDTGAVQTNWTIVPSVFNQNLIFNNIPATVTTICSVNTGDNDQVSIQFSDGTFGAIPNGVVRVWARSSTGNNLTIRPQDIPGVQIQVTYIAPNNLQKTLTMTFALQNSVSNSSPTESNASIKQNAPQVYYTRNRMVNGQDYNVFPLSNPLIMKCLAVNRTYSGFSRYVNTVDPTGFHQDVSVFSDDGMLYEEFDTEFNEVSSSLSSQQIVLQYVQPMIQTFGVQNFFYQEYAHVVNPLPANTYLVWNQGLGVTNLNTGRFVTLQNSPTSVVPPALYLGPSIQVGVDDPAESTLDYIIDGSLVYFNSAGWTTVQNVTNYGSGFNADGSGTILLSNQVLNNDYVTQIIPAFQTTLSATEIQNIQAQFNNRLSFGIRYDAPSGSWLVITGNNLDQNGPFSLANAGENSGINSDASWIVMCIFTGISWEITVRTLNYYFESVQDVRFFFLNQSPIVDQTTGLAVIDFIKVLKVNSQPNSSLPIGSDQLFTIKEAVVYPDGYTEPRRVIVGSADTNNNGIPDDPGSFLSIVGPQPSYLYWQITTDSEGYQVVIPTTAVVTWTSSLDLNGLSISQSQIIFFYDLLQFWQANINQQFTTPVSFNEEQQNFTNVSTQYQYAIGRNNLYFQWKHYAPEDQRIDPSATNIIDVYVLTSDYYSQIQTWLTTNPTDNSGLPDPPTTSQLDSSLSSLDDFKMISDELIFHPVSYKLLFGPSADPELQAQFQVVLTNSAALSPGQVQSQIISTINTYFNPQYWSFGDTFFASEMLAYITQQLAPNVASIVLVPLSGGGVFGDLYQITSLPNELFLSTATVDNILVVNALNPVAARIGS